MLLDSRMDSRAGPTRWRQRVRQSLSKKADWAVSSGTWNLRHFSLDPGGIRVLGLEGRGSRLPRPLSGPGCVCCGHHPGQGGFVSLGTVVWRKAKGAWA